MRLWLLHYRDCCLLACMLLAVDSPYLTHAEAVAALLFWASCLQAYPAGLQMATLACWTMGKASSCR